MPDKRATRKTTKKPGARSAAKHEGLSEGELSAMKDTLKERKAALRGEEAERAVRDRIASMQPTDRAIAERIHEIVRATAPNLEPRTWYGMPAYTKEGKVVCFFKDAGKFNTRYATFGFEEAANLDEGAMWPTSYALTKLTTADEKKIRALVKQAAS